MRNEGGLTRIKVSPCQVPISKTETTNRRFTVVSGATSGETMPETFEEGPQQSSRCAITHLPAHAPVKVRLSTPEYTSTRDVLGHVWCSEWLFCE